MRCENESTNRATEERSPFLDAHLKFHKQVFTSIKQRSGLLCILDSPKLDRQNVLDHAERIITARGAAEQAAEMNAEAKQALSAQTASLLDQNGELTADRLERAAYRLSVDALLARAGDPRERAHFRRAVASCDRAGQGQVPS